MGASGNRTYEELIRKQDSRRYFRTIDVTDAVIEKINAEQNQRHLKSYAFNRRAIISLVALSMILASVTAYAANSHLQIWGSSGKVVVRTSTPGSPMPEQLSQLLASYSEKVKSQLQPGELAAYYINDNYINKTNGYDTVNDIKFEYRPIQYRSLDQFIDAQHSTDAPVLKVPSKVPDGFSFSFGELFPAGFYPNSEESRESYVDLEQRLISRAGSEKQTFVMEKLPWSKAFTTTLYLSDGKLDTAVIVQAGHGLAMSLAQFDEDASEKIKLQHLEAVYIKSDDYGDKIGWYDEEESVAYMILSSTDSSVTKRQLIAIAESLIEEQMPR